MNFDEAREAVLQLLRAKGKAKNSEMLQAVGGNEVVWEEVREDLLFEELAKDIRGGGLKYTDPAVTRASVPAATPRFIFISYGRADATEFAKRLADDLEGYGHGIFLDLEAIERGASFDVRIEQAIRRADVVTAVMTHRSLAEDSVCRDEVVFALQSCRPILPLRVKADPDLKPTLLLARRNWVDFSEDYDAGLQSLVRYLSGDKSRLKAPILSTVTGAVPLDFSADIAMFSQRFNGREWLVKDLDQWLARSSRRAFVITAPAGAGKSAIAAWLYRTRTDVVGIHFCTARNTRTRDPHEFVACLVGQLQAEIPELAGPIGEKQPELRRETASDAFSELIVETSWSLGPQERKRLIIVDSLDEAAKQAGETVLDVLTTQASYLPDWLRIVTTTRPEEPIVDRLRDLKKWSMYEFEAHREENRADVQEYIQARLREPGLSKIAGNAEAEITARVESRAAGIFLQAEFTLDELVEGELSTEQLMEDASEQEFSYSEVFRRRFPDADDYSRRYAPILQALVAAREPLGFDVLRRLTELPEEALKQRLGTYIRGADDTELTKYRLVHQSLQDWLTDDRVSGPFFADEVVGHNRLCDAMLDRWADDDYALAHLPAHLVAAQRWEEAKTLLTDFHFLNAKVQALGPQPLVNDYDLVGEQTGSVSSPVGESLAAPTTNPELDDALRLLQGALRLSAHILVDNAGQLCSQLYARLLKVPNPIVLRLLESAKPHNEYWLRPLAPCLDGPVGPLMRTLKRHSGPVTALGLTADGTQVVSGSEDRTLMLWDWESGECKKTLKGHANGITDLCVFTDIVSASRDKTLKVWNAGSETPRKTLKDHKDVVRAVTAIPEKDLIVSASWDNNLKVWDSITGECVSTIRPDWRHWCHSLTATSDGQYVISGSEDTTLKVWNLQTQECEKTLKGHTGRVNAVAVTPDGRHLASASNDKTVRIWDMQKGDCLRTLRGHQGSVTCVGVTSDGRVVSGSEDNTLIVWDTSSDEVHSTLERHSDRVTAVAVTADGRRAISASADETLKVWNIEPGTKWEAWAIHDAQVNAICFTPDGSRAVSGSEDRTIKVWDTDTGECLLTLSGHTRRVNAVAAFPDGRRIISASSDATLRIWDLDAPSSDPKELRGNGDWFSAVSVVPSGDHVLSVSLRDSALTVWDVDSGEGTRISPSDEHVDVELGERLGPNVHIRWDSALKLWIVRTGDRVETLRGRHGVVSAASLTEDGIRAVVACKDYSLPVLNLKLDGVLDTLRGHEGRVSAVSLSIDGLRAASASIDRTVRVWDLENGKKLASFTGDAPMTACCVASDGVTIAAGDQGGRVCFLALQREEATSDRRLAQDQFSS